MQPSPRSQRPHIRARVQNACDSCKGRKVKCDGKVPCGYCTRRRRPEQCHYSPQRRRVSQHPQPASPPQTGSTSATSAELQKRASTVGSHPSTAGTPNGTSQGPGAGPDHHHLAGDGAAEDDTEVPREARLLCDAQGKLVFIGDCAPLSFFQSVRQLVTSRVDEHAFAPESSQYTVLENAPSSCHGASGLHPPEVHLDTIGSAVSAYLAATAGLVDLFEDATLADNIVAWASHGDRLDAATSCVSYLVLAIGYQKDREDLAQAYFDYARDRAFTHLSGELSINTVRAFVLVTLFMLGACQINGAFMFFGIAVRAAYSIGIHRTEVNSRFGPEVHQQRDRLWRSLRVVDLFLSTSMGRPPATSDVDCTVPYNTLTANGQESFDILSASVQIFLIIESVVLEIYSRRKISLQLTEGISRQLRDWSGRWLQPLKDAVASSPADSSHANAKIVGVCQVLSTYYYAVMLVSRPFLMYEVCRRISEGPALASRTTMFSGKSRLADACIDAASMMVDLISDLIERGAMVGKFPLIVSWLFSSSLVLGVGLLGSFGRILERYMRKSIASLEHFAQSDAHAVQYNLIAKSLLTTALTAVEKRELAERLQRSESSSQLFGLTPLEKGRLGADAMCRLSGDSGEDSLSPGAVQHRESFTRSEGLMGRDSLQIGSPGRMGDMDPAFLSLSGMFPRTPDIATFNNTFEGDVGTGALNLFPLLETSGHIDLAHYF